MPRRSSWRAPARTVTATPSLALELAGADPQIVARRRVDGSSQLASRADIVVVAGGFSYGDALGAGRMLALDITTGHGGRLGDALRGIRRLGPPGHRHLQRVPGAHPSRAASRRPRPQRRVALRVPVGHAGQGSRLAVRLDAARARRSSIARSPTARALRAPRPAALAAAGQVALRYAGRNPNGSVADIAGVCDETGLVLGLMPHPENHSVARQHPRHRRDRGPSTRSVSACSDRRCAMSPDELPAPFVDIELPLADRREGQGAGLLPRRRDDATACS